MKINKKTINRLPSILISFFVVGIIVIALIISANKMLEYIAIREELDNLSALRDNKLLQFDELRYYVNAEVNDEYREKMARLLGYCYPDEIIYYVE